MVTHPPSLIEHARRPARGLLDLLQKARTIRIPTLVMADMNGGVFGEEVTTVRISEPSGATTKCKVRAGEASAGTVGCGVKVNVPVQSAFTV
jgi:hypothetical protein